MTQDTYIINGHEFTDRDVRMIADCMTYSEGERSGLPGHNLLLLVAKLADIAHLKDGYDFIILADITKGRSSS